MIRHITVGAVALHLDEAQIHPCRQFQAIATVNDGAVALVANLFFGEHRYDFDRGYVSRGTSDVSGDGGLMFHL